MDLGLRVLGAKLAACAAVPVVLKEYYMWASKMQLGLACIGEPV